MARTASYDRDAALDAAMNLFWAKGYNATSLKDLEEALQMRPGSIYAAFRNKETLFKAALDRYADRMATELRTLVDDAPSPLTALQAHLRGMAQLDPCDKPSTACMLVKTLLEVPRGTEVREVVTAHLDQVERMLSQALRRAKALGELPADCDPDRLAQRIQTYIFGLKIQAQRETNAGRMRALCADLAEEIGSLRQTS